MYTYILQIKILQTNYNNYNFTKFTKKIIAKKQIIEGINKKKIKENKIEVEFKIK